MNVVKLPRPIRWFLPVASQMNVVKLRVQLFGSFLLHHRWTSLSYSVKPRWSLLVASQITSLSYSVKIVGFFLLHHRWTSSNYRVQLFLFLPVASHMNVVKLQRQPRWSLPVTSQMNVVKLPCPIIFVSSCCITHERRQTTASNYLVPSWCITDVRR